MSHCWDWLRSCCFRSFPRSLKSSPPGRLTAITLRRPAQPDQRTAHRDHGGVPGAPCPDGGKHGDEWHKCGYCDFLAHTPATGHLAYRQQFSAPLPPASSRAFHRNRRRRVISPPPRPAAHLASSHKQLLVWSAARLPRPPFVSLSGKTYEDPSARSLCSHISFDVPTLLRTIRLSKRTALRVHGSRSVADRHGSFDSQRVRSLLGLYRGHGAR